MIVVISDFDSWRETARSLTTQGISPSDVHLVEDDGQPLLLPTDIHGRTGAASHAEFTVPRDFVSSARDAAYHRDPDRWDLLYRVLWRLRNGEPKLLEIETDDDVARLFTMQKQVKRDAHKMKAFVRFRKIKTDEVEHFIAWHRPDHRVTRKVAPFFSRRFKAMNWTIFTPDESVAWDQHELTYGPGIARSQCPDTDALEELWITYYSNTFNPARVKIRMMKSEMPVRYWPTMPETEVIPDLLATAEQRVGKMQRPTEVNGGTVTDIIGRHVSMSGRPISTLDELAGLASGCTACDLHCAATQTVFGEGPDNARIIVVGEQPGDLEDRSGRPFVGPAGKILDEVFAQAGIARDDVYLTNVVKHFKHVSPSPADALKGKPRLHKKPNVSEVRACKPWLMAEWELLKKAGVLICLGATAATAIIGPAFRITQQRGTFHATPLCPQTIATWHPAAVLRAADVQQRESRLRDMIADLTAARNCLA